MARQAVVGRPLLLVAINAKAHRVIDGALGDGHLREIAMAGRALDFGPDMRRMVEPDVGFPDESVNPLPPNVFSTFRMVAQSLDSRIAGIANILMTTHTDIDARNSRPRALAHTCVTGVAKDADIVGMDLMRKIDRLLRPGLDIKKTLGRIAQGRVRSGKYRGTPSFGNVWIGYPLRISRSFRLLRATERDNRDGHQ